MTDINDNFWQNLTATVLSMAVAVGLCVAVPKLLDGIASGKPMKESSSGGKAADRLGYYSIRM